MKANFFLCAAALCLWCSCLFAQNSRIYINGAYYNDYATVYVSCASTSFNAQVQYEQSGTWFAATHYNIDALPSSWSYQLQPASYNKTSVDLTQNYPTTSGQLVITWGILGFGGSNQFHVNLVATPQLNFTSTPAIYGSYQSATYNLYAASSNNVTWTGYGGVQINGSNSYTGGQSATVSTQQYGGLLQATAYNACGTSPAISVVVGTPYVQSATVNGSPATSYNSVSSVGYLYLNTNSTASGANWVVTNGSGSIYPGGVNCQAYPSNFLRIVGTATNQYGSGQDWTFYIFKDGYSPYRMAYPNPAKDQVTLEFEDAIIAQELLKSLVLLDEKGKSWRDFNVSEAKTKKYFQQNKSITFDVKDMPKGAYYLHVTLGEKLSSERVLIE